MDTLWKFFKTTDFKFVFQVQFATYIFSHTHPFAKIKRSKYLSRASNVITILRISCDVSPPSFLYYSILRIRLLSTYIYWCNTNPVAVPREAFTFMVSVLSAHHCYVLYICTWRIRNCRLELPHSNTTQWKTVTIVLSASIMCCVRCALCLNSNECDTRVHNTWVIIIKLSALQRPPSARIVWNVQHLKYGWCG